MYGEKIKQYLDDNGIKYNFIANEIGMPINVFSALINDKRKITVDEYFGICFALKLDANYFAKKIIDQEQPTTVA